jgi:phage tail-like protein
VFGRFIGTSKPPTVVLKRAQSPETTLWAWHAQARAGMVGAFRDATLSFYDASGTRTAQYHLVNAWPSKLVVEGAPAKTGQIVLETVTFVADELIRG